MAKKLTKKQLKEPDEFQTVSMKVLQYVVKNRNRLYLLGIVLLAAVLAAGGYAYYERSYETKALELYAFATKAADPSSRIVPTDALRTYEELVTSYPRSDVAPLAYYHLGNLRYAVKEYDRAVEAYERYIDGASGKNKDRFMLSLAYYGMAYSFENMKDYSKALEAFQRSAEVNEDPAYRAMMDRNMGRVCESMGNIVKAREYYEKALVNLKDPLMEQIIRVILARMEESTTEKNSEKAS